MMPWLLRAKRWAQNPPSMGRVKFVAAIIVIVLILAGIERLGPWPDWAQADRMRPRRPSGS